jgi:two-component system chemotaxis response regulator CheY
MNNMEKPGQKLVEEFPSTINFLLLEDMVNIRKQLLNDLRMLGVSGKVYEAGTVSEAEKLASSEPIGFFICDWNLPDGVGIDFLRKMRNTLKYKTTPIIMCTTMSEVTNFLDAAASGANDYIVKPWQIIELQKKIQLTWTNYINKQKKLIK